MWYAVAMGSGVCGLRGWPSPQVRWVERADTLVVPRVQGASIAHSIVARRIASDAPETKASVGS